MQSENLDPDGRKLIEEWYLEYHQFLCNYLRRKIGPHPISQGEISDCVIDAFYILLEYHQSGKFVYKGDTKLKSWLKKTTFFRLTNYLNGQDNDLVHYTLYDEHNPHKTEMNISLPEKMERDKRKKLINRCIYDFIRNQSSRDRILLELKYYDQQKNKIKEIAKIMNTNNSWVKGRLFQLRGRLKRHLTDCGFNDRQILDSF